MPLSLNEIRARALAFSKEWEHDSNEDAEAKSFWDAFFNIFGISRRRVATFEEAVKREGRGQGYIDLLWKGVVLIEHKSRGKDLDRAYKQATDYFPGLKDHELPRYIIVCDFDKFRLYDLDTNEHHDFTLAKLADNLHLFDFLSGYKRHTFKEQDPINEDAALMMGELHDNLKAIGYDGHRLELYLVRLLFCLFADDTNIFEKGTFQEYIDIRTAEDGSDLAARLAQMFEVLNTPKEERLRNLDESLNIFPYVNGKLFEEHLPTASFDAKMRKLLLDCCGLDWSAISPAIFGSLFQSVMDEKARRNLGAHYTSEKNIMKLIKPLFLDELWDEFRKADSRPKMQKFHEKIAALKFLDPACGCGNFLIIAYRELRLLEIEVVKFLLKDMQAKRQAVTDIKIYFEVNVDQFYGIEYEEFPAQIAQVAMWLMDHQMNMQVSEEFGDYYARLPLKKSATIAHGNALRIDWQSLISEEGKYYNYILGNPPFLGKKEQNTLQKADMEQIFTSTKGAGVLDYVTAWYARAAQYMQTSTYTKCAFVSTNSISQGEQVSILWSTLYHGYGVKIYFAHQTFKWNNDAKGNAAVHVVIIGFAKNLPLERRIFEYEDIKGEPHEFKVKNINPYLVDANDVFLENRKKPLCSVPEMNYGSMPIDDGHLILSDEEKKEVIREDPETKFVIRPYTGGDEFINNKKRWCIWITNDELTTVKKLKSIQQRVLQTKKFRENSNREATKKLAQTPYLFGEIRQPNTSYIIIPKVSSETRKYIPIGILKPKTIASGSCLIIPNANLYTFGVLTSIMHMSWMKKVCGRMKSDYQYSNSIVYNNFPWPEDPSDKQKEAVEKAAQAVLDWRAQFPNASLADLYDPLTMPRVLVTAHLALDKAVDLCYRPQPFINETKRIEYLFELYDKYTAGLFVADKKKTKKKKEAN